MGAFLGRLRPYGCIILSYEKRSKGHARFVQFYYPLSNFFSKRSWAMIFWGSINPYKTYKSPRLTPQYVHPNGTPISPISGTTRKMGKIGGNWPRNLPPTWGYVCGGVPGGCTYCTSLRAMKDTYIGFQSTVISISVHVF